YVAMRSILNVLIRWVEACAIWPLIPGCWAMNSDAVRLDSILTFSEVTVSTKMPFRGSKGGSCLGRWKLLNIGAIGLRAGRKSLARIHLLARNEGARPSRNQFRRR